MPVPYTVSDIVPWTQAVAGLNQFIFSTNWTANATSDILVYNRVPGIPANDVLQLVDSSLYLVEFVGSDNIVQVTFIVPPLQGNIITIIRATPSQFLNTYTNTNFLPSMLNGDFEQLTLIDQQNQLMATQYAPHYNSSASVILQNSVSGTGGDEILPILGANQFWVKSSDNTQIVAIDVPEGIAPDNSTYLVQTSTPSLPDAFNLGTLSTGLLKLTVAVGFATPSTAINGTDYWAPGDILTIPADPTLPNDVANKAYVDSSVGVNGTVNPGLINQLAWYAASGTTLSGLATSASKILVTNASGIPGLSSTLPGFNLAGTLNTAGQIITNATADGNILLNTNGAGLITINSTQGVNGVSNDSTLSADSTTLLPTQAAVKAYVDLVVGTGFSLVGAVVVANTSNFAATYANGAAGVGATLTQTIAAIVTIDGVTLTLNQRVLFTGQTSTFQNGIYQISTLGTGAVQAIFTRTTDYDTAAEIEIGTLVPVLSGTINGGSIWLESDVVVTVGTDPIQFIVYAQPSNTFVTLSTNQTITGIKQFNSGSLRLLGATSGTSILNAAAIAGSTTFTLPSTSDVLAGIAATQTLTNKSIDGLTNTFTNISYLNLANGTAGNMITWSPGGTPALVATGNAGDILTSNGVGLAPSFQSNPSGIYVTVAGVQTITGAKTFNQQILAPSLAFSTSSGIIGVTNGSNAPAGTVEEYLSNIVSIGAALPLSSSVARTICVLTLEPGDYDVWCEIWYTGQTITAYTLSSAVVSLTNNGFPSGPSDNVAHSTIPTNGTIGAIGPPVVSSGITRQSLSITTNVYGVAFCLFSGGSMSAYGALKARRVR